MSPKILNIKDARKITKSQGTVLPCKSASLLHTLRLLNILLYTVEKLGFDNLNGTCTCENQVELHPSLRFSQPARNLKGLKQLGVEKLKGAEIRNVYNVTSRKQT